MHAGVKRVVVDVCECHAHDLIDGLPPTPLSGRLLSGTIKRCTASKMTAVLLTGKTGGPATASRRVPLTSTDGSDEVCIHTSDLYV